MKWLSKLVNSIQDTELAKDLAKARGKYLSNVLEGMKEEDKKKLLALLLEENKDNEDN